MATAGEIRRERQNNDANYTRFLENREWERNNAQADWQLQNQYNSPEQQMERLRQAGLNPNLVYGQGANNTAMAIARTNGSPPEAKYQKNYGKSTDQIMQASQNFGDSLGQYYQNQNVQAQTDNLYEQNALLQKEQMVKDLEIIDKGYGNTAKGIEVYQKQALKDNVIQQQQLQTKNLEADLVKKQADTQFTISENQRKQLANTQDVELTVQKILSEKLNQSKSAQETAHLKVMIENAKLEGKIKTLDAKLAEQNIRPTDPLWWRVVGSELQKMTSDKSKVNEKRNWRGEVDVNTKGLGGPTR